MLRHAQAPVGRTLAAALRAEWRAVARLVFWVTVGSVPAFVHGYAIAHALDDGFLAGNRDAGLRWLAVLGAAVVLGAVGSARAMLAVGTVAESFRDRLVTDVVRGTLHRSTQAGARADTTGVARLSQQVEIARMTMGSSLLVALEFVVCVSAAVVGMSRLSVGLLPLVVVPVAVALALFVAALPAVARRERTAVLGGELVAADLNNVAAGLRDVRAAGAGTQVRAEVGADIEAQASAVCAIARMTGLRLIVVGVGGRLPVVLILLGAPWLLRNGVSPGELVGSLTYVLTAIAPAFHSLAEGVGDHGVKLWVVTARLSEAAPPPAPAAPASPRPPSPGPAAPAVDARALRFAYGPHAQPVVDGLDLVVRHGERLAVVGPSGIGKSTLAALLSGTLRPDEGRVLLDGIDVVAAGPVERARLRVLIPQEAYVFTGTLRDNLRYLRSDATDEELTAAAAAVGCAELCERLGGLDTTVDPSALSAGERQLLALARAYCVPAPLVVLDEATCHLDPEAEARAEAAFARRPGALVVVAHRVTSALRADRVLVLDGTRALLGTHAELLGSCPLYAELVGHWTGTHAAPA